MEKKQFLILLGTLSVAFFLGAFFGIGAYFHHVVKSDNTLFLGDKMVQQAIADNDDVFSDVNKMMKDQQKEFSSFNKSFFTQNSKNSKDSGFIFFENGNASSNTITTEELKNMYKITVNLKPFNNDAKNIKVKIRRNRVSISAHSKDKNNSANIYQSFSLPCKVNSKAVKQVQKNNNLIITIPKVNK